MKALTTILIATFVLISIALPLAMHHGVSTDINCLIADIAKLPCIALVTNAEHVNALQRVLTAIPTVLTLFAIAFAICMLFLIRIPRGAAATHNHSRLFTDARTVAQAPVLAWHAFLTHSPTVA